VVGRHDVVAGLPDRLSGKTDIGGITLTELDRAIETELDHGGCSECGELAAEKEIALAEPELDVLMKDAPFDVEIERDVEAVDG
jgi:hypothetical protein